MVWGGMVHAHLISNGHQNMMESSKIFSVRALELKCQSWNDSGIWHFEE